MPSSRHEIAVSMLPWVFEALSRGVATYYLMLMARDDGQIARAEGVRSSTRSILGVLPLIHLKYVVFGKAQYLYDLWTSECSNRRAHAQEQNRRLPGASRFPLDLACPGTA